MFGSTGFMLGCFENAEKETKFKELFASIFNLVVVPFYWNTLEPEEGKLRFQKDSENIYKKRCGILPHLFYFQINLFSWREISAS